MPETPVDLAAARQRIERAHTEIGQVCAQGPSRRFRMHIPADPERDTDLIITAALNDAELLAGEVEQLRAALARVVDLAKDMRSCCSPHGVATGYAGRIAEAIFGTPYPHKPGEALAKLDDLTAGFTATQEQWRQVALHAEDRFARAQQLLANILATFTQHGHPGRAAIRTGWIDQEQVDGWRKARRDLLTEASPATVDDPQAALARVRAEHAAIHAEMDDYARTHNPDCDCDVIPATRETADRMLAALDGEAAVSEQTGGER